MKLDLTFDNKFMVVSSDFPFELITYVVNLPENYQMHGSGGKYSQPQIRKGVL